MGVIDFVSYPFIVPFAKNIASRTIFGIYIILCLKNKELQYIIIGQLKIFQYSQFHFHSNEGSGTEIDDMKVDEIIQAHTDTVNGLMDEVGKNKADADRLPTGEKKLKELKNAKAEYEWKNA